MKQTNNAIKFLMAQYRAIFNNAYFKGLASAALVTVAMAAGQAQAATLSDFISGSSTSNVKGDFTTTENSETISGSAGGYLTNLTVTNGKTLNFGDGTNANTGHIRVSKTVEVQSGGDLTLKGANNQGLGIVGTFDDSFNDNADSKLVVNQGTVTVTGSQIQMNRVELNNATVSVGTAIGDNSNSGWKDLAMINAEVAWNAEQTAIVEGTGVFSVTGAADKVLTLDSGSQALAAQFDLNGGKIVMKSQTGDDKGSVIRAYTEGDLSVINLTGSTIEANTGKDNYLAGRTININGGTIDIKDNAGLHVSGTLDDSKNAIAEAQQSGTINFTSGSLTIGSNGSLTVEGLTNKKGTTFNVSKNAQLSGTGSVELGEKAHLNIDKSIIDGFVKTGNNASTGNGGKIVFNGKTSKVTINSTEYVNLSDYAFGSGTNADFDVASGSTQWNGTIKGEKLALTKKTDGTLTAGKIDLGADNVKLGGSATGESNKLSELKGSVFQTISAYKNIDFQGTGDKFELDSSDVQGVNKTEGFVGTFTGADLSFTNGRLFVLGNWKSEQNITLTGGGETRHGNVIVGNGTKYDSSLVLTGTIKNDKDANTWGALKASASNTNTNTLDITGATLESTGNQSSLVSLVAETNGILKVTGEQVTSILKGDANTKGFALSVTGKGNLDIQTLKSGGILDIQGDFSANFDDFGKFTGNGATDANKITFGKWEDDTKKKVIDVGGYIIANKATLTGSGDFSLHAEKSLDVVLNLADLDITNTTPSATDVTLKSGSFRVTNNLNSANKNLVIGEGADLYLETTTSGSVTGLETITVSGNNTTADHELCISGKWDLSNTGLVASNSGGILLDATYSKADVVSKSLTTSTSGTLTIEEGSSLKVTGALSTEDNSVKVRGDSTFTVDYTQANSGTALGKVVVDGSSTLVLDGFTGENISLADLQKQKSQFLSGTTGLFKITKNGQNVSVTGTATGPEVSFDDAKEAANLEGIYANQTITGVSGSINTTNDWGTVKLDASANKLDLGTSGSVILNGANGNTNLVADKDGAAADVQLGSDSMLTVKGSGTIKDVLSSGDGQGTLRVDDNVSLTAGNIGSNTTTDLKEVVVDAKSSLTAKNVFANELAVDGTLTAKDVTLGTLDLAGNATVDNLTLTGVAAVDGSLTVNKALSSAENIQVNGNLQADSLTLTGSDKSVSVGQDGEESKSGLLDVGALDLAGGSLIIDPAYNLKASLGYVGGTKVQEDIVLCLGAKI